MLPPAEFETLLSRLEETSEAFWNISRENARFLSLLIQTMNASRVLEIGTSNGYSTLWFARAVGETGHVTAMEFDANRAQMARENYQSAGLADRIRLLVGDARALLPTLAGGELFDFVFLDAEKPEYHEYLLAVLPFVRVGGLIVGDDTLSLKDKMPAYRALVFDHPQLQSVEVPIDDGVILSRKIA